MCLQQLAPGIWGHSEDMADNSKIVNQLRALVLLTKTEEQVARTRISQARTDAVRRELTQNADNAAARTIEITEALRSLGGVPDVVTPALGRLSATLKATFEQAEVVPSSVELRWRPVVRQAATTSSSCTAGGTVPAISASSAARSLARCRWPLTRRNCLPASTMPAAHQRSAI
jgi:hypothetical protein